MMEALSSALEPHKDIIGSVAAFVTMAQFFSGIFICKEIKDNGSTDGIASTPFVGGVAVGLAMLRYGQLLNDNAMIQVNVFAIFLNVVYTIFYGFYSRNKWDELIRPCSMGAALVAVLWSYCSLEDSQLIEHRYGLVVTLLMLALLGAPLAGIGEIIRSQNASSIPLVMTMMAEIVTFLWLIYGFAIRNNFTIIQNAVGFALCTIQLCLKYRFRSRPHQD